MDYMTAKSVTVQIQAEQPVPSPAVLPYCPAAGPRSNVSPRTLPAEGGGGQGGSNLRGAERSALVSELLAISPRWACFARMTRKASVSQA